MGDQELNMWINSIVILTPSEESVKPLYNTILKTTKKQNREINNIQELYRKELRVKSEE